MLSNAPHTIHTQICTHKQTKNNNNNMTQRETRDATDGQTDRQASRLTLAGVAGGLSSAGSSEPRGDEQLGLVEPPTEMVATKPETPQGSDSDPAPSLLEGVRKLVEADPALVCPVTDQFLGRFLWAADLDVNKSYHLIQEYFAARRDYPDVFLLNDPNSYISIFKSNELGFELADRDPLGRRIFVARIGDMDPSRHKFEDVLQTCLMTLESLSVDPEVQRLGIVVLVDITRFSYKLVRWLTPYKIKVSLKFLQDCIPLKMQAFYCVNAPRVFSLTYNAVKPLMKEEFRRKISWHNGDLASLHKLLPPCILPEEFGGTRQPAEWADWYSHVLEKTAFFEELRSYGYVVKSS